MFRTTTYVVTALIPIALGISVRQWFLSNLDQAAEPQAVLSVKTLTAAAGSRIEPAALSSDPSLGSREVERAKRNESHEHPFVMNDSSVSASAHRPTVTSQQNISAEFQSSANIHAAALESEAIGPDAVIGRPFPVSASVEADCKNSQFGLSEDSPCHRAHQKLSILANEPRDASWATATAAKLRHAVTSDPGKCMIRAIECRTSVCAVECASLYGVFLGPGYEFERDNRLRKDISMWGYETDPAGARVTVTVIAYTRR